MPQPVNLIHRFRVIILTVLVAVTIGYGYYLYRMYVPAAPPPPPPSIPVAVMADGSVRVDGVSYAAPDQLKPKIAELQRDHPGAGFAITAAQGQDFNAIAKAVVLMQNSGAKTVWVINEPKKPAAP
jgi:biopolymer transport protein ExbD